MLGEMKQMDVQKPVTRSLLHLVCRQCGADMPRSLANGLLIGDGTVDVVDFSQDCTACGNSHLPGTWLSFWIGPGKE